VTFTETLLVRLGSALRGPLYNAWRRRTGRTEQNARTLQDLIALDVRNAIASTRIERDISSLAEYMAETLLPVFSTDGIAFSDNEKAAISLALAQTFEEAGLGTQIFLQNDLSPDKLGNYYLSLSTDYRKDFTEREQTFLDACIKEICGRLLDVADQLPGLTAAFQREILQRQSALFALGQSILDEIKKFTEKKPSGSALIVDNFNLLCRQAVKRAFGHVHVFGLDMDRISTRLALDISYISLRVGSDNVRVGASEDYDASFDDIDTISHDLKADQIPTHTRRALLLGHAGSGKTTLLQWLCTKMVGQSLTGRLAALNRCVPFFIRLREFYEKDLPVGKQLISCASRALVEQVPDDWIGEILSKGRAVFLVDGIDEISARQRAARPAN
jgi:hypothetical protein